MKLRKVLQFSSAIGFTIPKEYANALGLKPGTYAEVFLRDNKTIVIKKHGVEFKKIREDE